MAEDVDGDGLDDILIGASKHDVSGKSYLIFGSSLGSTSLQSIARIYSGPNAIGDNQRRRC